MKNKKNDGKYVIIDDGTAGGLFLSENEYYVDENKKVVLCNSEKKDNLFRKRYKHMAISVIVSSNIFAQR